MTDQNTLQDLANKWLKGTITPEEKEKFNNWFSELAEEPIEITESYAVSEEAHENKMWNIIHQKIAQEKKPVVKRLNRRVWIAAASLFVICSTALYLTLHSGDQSKDTASFTAVIKPGGDKAFLTLANGKRIILKDIASGVLATEANVQISKTDEGQLAYHYVNDDRKTAGPVLYNIIETPRGGEYQVLLPDGSKAWLNAASKLKYPVSFAAAKTRTVELSGEGYFEVAKDKEHPFQVKTDNQEVEVLGTKFNINSYKDEAIVKTTLVEGRVKVFSSQNSKILLPGQQAKLQAGYIKVETVNAVNEIGWKNGKFTFNDEELGNVMRKISRWYDIEVVFQDPQAAKKVFSGKMSRSDDINTLLRKLQKTGEAKFKIEGRKVIVL
ncbi:hypothetical protein TH53_00495 [Pedobacter lusitanus]|uniref:FecR protein n=1 Tax=Pedobacter lusitanus TaxID=1503925 RepID=A0A0D0GP02_9SPHI|nr:FecR domain-containing protein [Pedobacter lusitanus]KIO78997.1 hypothetical protein TH53_00495 [Pedobacter lusitanus]